MSHLIDSIVRQTTILIAALATAAGNRASLANVANQVFVDLVHELKRQGVGNKVIADMFGLALRTYHDKVSRLSESLTYKGQSLWEAVLAYTKQAGPLTRAEIHRRFSRDDAMQVRSVLKDLVDSGLVFRAGVGDATVYRAATPQELSAGQRDEEAALSSMLLVAINEYGPIGRDALLTHVPLSPASLDGALERLVEDGRVQALDDAGGGLRYACGEYTIGFHDPNGWEAAIFDHYQAMVTAICGKLARGLTQAVPQESIGGSTYAFDLWEGHPMQDEVLGLLSRLRDSAAMLRKRVDEYNLAHRPERVHSLRVTTYVGQNVRLDEETNEETSEEMNDD